MHTFKLYVFVLTNFTLIFVQTNVDAALGSDCSADFTVCDTSNNEICTVTTCVCGDGFYESGGFCASMKVYGDGCAAGSSHECPTELACVSQVNRCLCADGSYYNTSTCISTNVLKPYNLQNVKTYNSVNLSWTSPFDTDLTNSYVINYSTVGGTERSHNVSGQDLSTLIPNLSPRTTYTFTVVRSITREGRTQTVPTSDPYPVTTNGVYSDNCTTTAQCKRGLVCVVSKCLCAEGTFFDGTMCTKNVVLKPYGFGSRKSISSVYLYWTSPVANGYTNSFAINFNEVGGSSQTYIRHSSVSSKTFSNLRPDTTYTVSVVRSVTREGRTQTVPVSEPYNVITDGIYTARCTAMGKSGECVAGLECVAGIQTICLCQEGNYFTGYLCKSIDELKPTNVVLEARSFNSITLSWTAPVAINYTSIYAVLYTTQGGFLQTYNVVSHSTAVIIPYLNPGTTYTFTVVRSITKYGRTQIVSASDTQKTTTRLDFGYFCDVQASECRFDLVCRQDKCHCAYGKLFANGYCVSTSNLRPSISSIQPTSTSTTTVTWTSPPAAEYTNSYVIKYTEEGTKLVGTSPVSGDVSTHLVTGLKAGTSYTFSVVRSIIREGMTLTVIASLDIAGVTKESEDESHPDTNIVIIVVVDVFLVLAAVLLIVYFKVMRPRCQKKRNTQYTENNQEDSTEGNRLSVIQDGRPVDEYNNMEDVTPRSENPYDELTAYSNEGFHDYGQITKSSQ